MGIFNRISQSILTQEYDTGQKVTKIHLSIDSYQEMLHLIKNQYSISTVPSGFHNQLFGIPFVVDCTGCDFALDLEDFHLREEFV